MSSIKELAALQESFQGYLLSGDPAIAKAVVQTKQVAVDTRLGIYKDAYSLRLIESMQTTFPAVLAYLGDTVFQEVCLHYIQAHPSPYRSIRWYGDKFAAFLQGYYDESFAFLAELAEFEWKMTAAFDAKDEKVLQVSDMMQVAPESWAGLCFAFHPSVQRMHCFWKSIPLWQALMQAKESPELKPNSQATSWILWRSPDYLIPFYSVSEEEAWALDAIAQGLSFGQICEGLCVWIAEEEVGMRAASYLKNWIQQGMLLG